MVSGLLPGSDKIAMLPSRILTEAPDLAGVPVPVPVMGFALHLGSRRRRAKSAGLRYASRHAGSRLRLSPNRYNRLSPSAAELSMRRTWLSLPISLSPMR